MSLSDDRRDRPITRIAPTTLARCLEKIKRPKRETLQQHSWAAWQQRRPECGASPAASDEPTGRDAPHSAPLCRSSDCAAVCTASAAVAFRRNSDDFQAAAAAAAAAWVPPHICRPAEKCSWWRAAAAAAHLCRRGAASSGDACAFCISRILIRCHLDQSCKRVHPFEPQAHDIQS